MNFPTSQTPPTPSSFPPSNNAIAVEPAGPGLSEPERLINTFIAPAKTFTDIRRNASWWVPLLLVSVFAIGFFITIDQKIGFDQVAHSMMASNPRMQQMS